MATLTNVEAIRREHVEVGQHLGLLQELLATPRLDWPRVEAEVIAFQERLLRHFALEEEDYLSDVPRDSARVESEVQALRGEHVTMRVRLERLRARAAARDGRNLRRGLEELLALLARHEEREGALLHAAVAGELGGGD